MDRMGGGFVAMALGAIGWLTTGRQPCPASPRTPAARRDPVRWPVGSVELHLSSVLSPSVLGATVVQSTPAAVAVTIGLGAFTAVIAVWSLLAADPTRDYLTLAVVGLTLFRAPWLAGFAGDQAAWAAWIPGVTATALGVAGYLRGESLDFARTVRADADARYRERHG